MPEQSRCALKSLTTSAPDDPRKRKTYAQLLESIAAAGGINVPLFITESGQIIDGNTRWCCLIDLGHADAPCITLPPDWTEAEILKWAIATDGVRRKLPIEELALKGQRYIDLTGCTQDAAARELGISAGYFSRALAVLCLPEAHLAKASGLADSVKMLIATLRDSALQEKVLEHAATPDASGKLPTREAVELFIQRNRKGKQPKPRLLKGKVSGRNLSLELRKDESTDDVIESLKELVGKLQKFRDLDPADLGFLLK